MAWTDGPPPTAYFDLLDTRYPTLGDKVVVLRYLAPWVPRKVAEIVAGRAMTGADVWTFLSVTELHGGVLVVFPRPGTRASKALGGLGFQPVEKVDGLRYVLRESDAPHCHRPTGR